MGKNKEKSKNTANEEKDQKLGTCKEVHARHILCQKQSAILEVENQLKKYTDDGEKVPPEVFGQLASNYSECSSKKRGGDLGCMIIA